MDDTDSQRVGGDRMSYYEEEFEYKKVEMRTWGKLLSYANRHRKHLYCVEKLGHRKCIIICIGGVQNEQ